MRRFSVGAFLVLTFLVGVVAAVAYSMGVSAGTADAAIAAGASVIYAPASFSPLGLIIGGFFLLLFIGFLARLIAGPRMSMGPGGWSHHSRHRGGWDHDTVPERFQPMLERWHRDAHAAATGGPHGKPPVSPAPSPGRPPTGQAPLGPRTPKGQPPAAA